VAGSGAFAWRRFDRRNFCLGQTEEVVRFRGTIVLLGVFAVLGGYVYFAEYRGHDEREQKKSAAKKLFPTPPKDVTGLTLVYPDHKISAVKKDDKHWEITEPQGIDADSEAWEMLVSSLSQIEKGDVVAAKPDLAPFELDKPAIDVTAHLKDGHDVRVLFGAENPKKTDNYAKLADSSEVFLSPSNWSKTFQKSLTDMRNKKILDLAAEDINSIRIDDGKSPIEFQKSGTDWQLKMPAALKADNSEVSGFLSSILSARAVSFADEKVDPKTTGLNPPSYKVTLHDGKANADRTLSIGKSPETDKYYARDESRPAVFIIDKEIPGKVRRPVMDWRDKSVAHVEPESVDEIEIIRGAEKFSVKKQGADWKLADGRKVQSEKISNALTTLEFERASQILDTPGKPAEYGLDKPRLEVTLRQSGKDILGLKFGTATRNPEGSYLKVSTSMAVMTVTADFYDKFSLKTDDIVEKQPAAK
jgi:hypothetical protein